MNKNVLRTLVVCLAILIAVTPPARAFLGIGDVVFDPTNYAEAIEQLTEMQRQLDQMVQTYLIMKSQYDQMRFMAKPVPVNMGLRYRALATLWRLSTATNTYGTTGGWRSGINTGIGIASGYNSATVRLGQYGNAFKSIPADQQDRVKTSYATVELTDGANQNTMDTVGRLRANSGAVERAIQWLEDDSLSSDPDMNTEIAVLNKMNAASLIGVRTSQDTNKLLVALAETQAIEAKRTRDAEAQSINNHIRFMSEGRDVMTAQGANASGAMLAWRLP